jgi:hypothetical protein
MALQVAAFSIELIEALRPIVPRVKRHDRSLADQLVRAASSVALNIAEAEHSDPGTAEGALLLGRGKRKRDARDAQGSRCVGLFPRAGGRERYGNLASHHRHALEAHAGLSRTAAFCARAGAPGGTPWRPNMRMQYDSWLMHWVALSSKDAATAMLEKRSGSRRTSSIGTFWQRQHRCEVLELGIEHLGATRSAATTAQIRTLLEQLNPVTAT